MLDQAGTRLTPTAAEVVHRQPLMTATWLKGTWEVPLREAGPYFLLITSQHHDAALVGSAGNTAVHTSSPVGKIRIGVERLGAPAIDASDRLSCVLRSVWLCTRLRRSR